MVICQYNLYIFGIHLWTVLYVSKTVLQGGYSILKVKYGTYKACFWREIVIWDLIPHLTNASVKTYCWSTVFLKLHLADGSYVFHKLQKKDNYFKTLPNKYPSQVSQKKKTKNNQNKANILIKVQNDYNKVFCWFGPVT